jgi:hypothetical protein
VQDGLHYVRIRICKPRVGPPAFAAVLIAVRCFHVQMHFLHFQTDRSYAHIALFRNVLNSEKLKNRIVSASLTEGELGDKEREALNFAFINARLVSNPSMLIGYY